MTFNYLLACGKSINIKLTSLDRFNFSKKSGIYIIVNKRNGKSYVGQAKTLRGRMQNHIYRLNKGIHVNKHLQRAFNKDGDMFVAGTLEEFNSYDKDSLTEREAYYMGLYETLNRKYGYNMAPAPESKHKAFKKREFRNDYITSEVVIKKICKELNAGKTRTEIANMMDVNMGVVSGIASGATYSDFTVKHLNKSVLAQWRHHIEKTGLTEKERMYYSTNKTRKSNARLTKQKVLEICSMMNDDLSDKEISERMDISQSTINNIRRGKNWHDISILALKPEILNMRNVNRDQLIKVGFTKEEIGDVQIRTYSKLEEETIHSLCRDIQSAKLTIREMADKYNVDTTTIRRVMNGRNHKEIAKQYDIIGKKLPFGGYHMSIGDAENIWKCHLKGMKTREIEAETGINAVNVRRVISGKTFKDVYEKYTLKKEA